MKILDFTVLPKSKSGVYIWTVAMSQGCSNLLSLPYQPFV